MRNKKDEWSARKRRRKNRWIDGGIILIFIILAGSVIGIGMNGWKIGSSDGLHKETESTATFSEIRSYDSDEVTESNEEETSPAEIRVDEKKPEDEKLRDVKESSIEELPVETPVQEEENSVENGVAQEPVKPSNPTDYIKGQELPKEPMLIQGVLLANKKYPLPEDYAPGESKEAREAFNELAASAVTSGINLQAFSTYRSYDYQVTLYNRYVERDGQEAADRYSARPGYSEHQTGLAFDIGEVNHEKYWASNSFGDTEAAKWLAANAHQYGFILRYPEGKEEVTGYMHESWHYRYVGKDMAEQIFKRNITLEEYLNVR